MIGAKIGQSPCGYGLFIGQLGDRLLGDSHRRAMGDCRLISSMFDYMKATESPGDGRRPTISGSAMEQPSGYGPLKRTNTQNNGHMGPNISSLING